MGPAFPSQEPFGPAALVRSPDDASIVPGRSTPPPGAFFGSSVRTTIVPAAAQLANPPPLARLLARSITGEPVVMTPFQVREESDGQVISLDNPVALNDFRSNTF